MSFYPKVIATHEYISRIKTEICGCRDSNENTFREVNVDTETLMVVLVAFLGSRGASSHVDSGCAMKTKLAFGGYSKDTWSGERQDITAT